MIIGMPGLREAGQASGRVQRTAVTGFNCSLPPMLAPQGSRSPRPGFPWRAVRGVRHTRASKTRPVVTTHC